MRIRQAEFEASYTSAEKCPPDDVPEFAFIGRSNVGKSSLLNSLTGKKNLARVSQTPGCTRLINFFLVNDGFRFVDLPGYGFAKMDKGGREVLQHLIAGYLEARPNLRCVFVLIDSRLDPQRIDLEFLEWLAGLDKAFDLVFTKTDKVKPSALNKNAEAFLGAIAPVRPEVHTTSTKTGEGRLELLRRIGDFLKG
jgi:GTP-binding protein